MTGILSWVLPVLLLQAPGVRGQDSKPQPQVQIRNHFDSDEPVRAPAFFDFVVLGGPGPASWRVVTGINPPSSPNQLSQVIGTRPRDSVAVAVRRNVSFQDGSLSVALLKGSGRAGIVFRMAGEKDFRSLLVDLKTGETNLTSYDGGRPVELGRGDAELKNQWGILSVTAMGPRIAAQWDGKLLFEATDSSPRAGRAGVATSGPGMTSFDEFLLETSKP